MSCFLLPLPRCCCHNRTLQILIFAVRGSIPKSQGRELLVTIHVFWVPWLCRPVPSRAIPGWERRIRQSSRFSRRSGDTGVTGRRPVVERMYGRICEVSNQRVG